MKSQDGCKLLDLGPLPLDCVWLYASKLDLKDRKALLSTCKKSLQTFVRCMTMLRLTMRGTMRGAPPSGSSDGAVRDLRDLHTGTGSYRDALKTLFLLGPDAVFTRLELIFVSSPGETLMRP